ncbi:MAG: hypothetical protein WCR06_01475 [bacterium]
MKLSLASLLLVCLFAAVCCAQEFSLQDEKGKMTGPYALKTGTEVAIGSNRAVIANIRTQKQQILDDLREIVIPELEFQQTSLRDAVAFLQRAAAKADTQKRVFTIKYGLMPEQEQTLKATPITFAARNLSAFDTLRLITELTKTKYAACSNGITVLPRDAPESELIVRKFPVRNAVIESLLQAAAEGNPEFVYQPDTLKRMLGDLGVSWPTGSWISYVSVIGRLRVCNTQDNLDIIERLIQELGGAPRQVRLSVQFVAFDLARLNRLVVSGASINAATLTTLWSNGFGELLAAPTAVVKPGQEVDVKGVTELIYPTTFTFIGADQTNSPNAHAAGVPYSVEPGGFQTREIGSILQVVPEVSADGKIINLNLNPQIVEDPVWHDFGPVGLNPTGQERHGPMKQPYFHVYSVSTSVSVQSGKRVLIGGGMPTRDLKRAVYLFVTATTENEQGEAIRPLPDDAEHHDQPFDKCFTPRFSLQDGKGNVTGPYMLQNGVKLRLGASQAILTQVDALHEGDLQVRWYSMSRPAMERSEGISCGDGEKTNQVDSATKSGTNRSEDLKKFFGDLGVAWPDGSSITYLPAFEKLVIRSTREQLNALERVFEEFNCTLRQIRIDAQFVSYDRTNIARMAAAGKGFNTAALTALWTNGFGELLATPMVVTKAGVEGVVKGVTEAIYPCGSFMSALEPMDGQTPVGEGPGSQMGGFQTRETGTIVQVVPEVSAEGEMINLTLNPQIVEDPDWEEYGSVCRDARKKEYASPVKQPQFHVYATSTSVSLANGHRIMVGGGMPSRDGRRMVYLFVTATIVDEQGEVVVTRDDEDL